MAEAGVIRSPGGLALHEPAEILTPTTLTTEDPIREALVIFETAGFAGALAGYVVGRGRAVAMIAIAAVLASVAVAVVAWNATAADDDSGKAAAGAVILAAMLTGVFLSTLIGTWSWRAMSKTPRETADPYHWL